MDPRIGRGTTAGKLNVILDDVHNAPKSPLESFRAAFKCAVNCVRRFFGATAKSEVIESDADFISKMTLVDPAKGYTVRSGKGATENSIDCLKTSSALKPGEGVLPKGKDTSNSNVRSKAVDASGARPIPTEASTAPPPAPKNDLRASVDGIKRMLAETKRARKRMSKPDRSDFEALKNSLKTCLSTIEKGRSVKKEELSALGIELINMQLFAAGLKWAAADAKFDKNKKANANTQGINGALRYEAEKMSIRQNVPDAFQDECDATLSRHDKALGIDSRQTVPKRIEGEVTARKRRQIKRKIVTQSYLRRPRIPRPA